MRGTLHSIQQTITYLVLVQHVGKLLRAEFLDFDAELGAAAGVDVGVVAVAVLAWVHAKEDAAACKVLAPVLKHPGVVYCQMDRVGVILEQTPSLGVLVTAGKVGCEEDATGVDGWEQRLDQTQLLQGSALSQRDKV